MCIKWPKRNEKIFLIWKKIFYYLEDNDIITISLVNINFYKIIIDNNFWMLKYEEYENAIFNVYESIKNFLYICKKINNVTEILCLLHKEKIINYIIELCLKLVKKNYNI
jgi:hypothetical protein